MTGLQAAILGGSALILLVLALRLGLQRHLPRRLSRRSGAQRLCASCCRCPSRRALASGTFLSGLPLLRQREQFLGRFCPSPI